MNNEHTNEQATRGVRPLKIVHMSQVVRCCSSLLFVVDVCSFRKNDSSEVEVGATAVLGASWPLPAVVRSVGVARAWII